MGKCEITEPDFSSPSSSSISSNSSATTDPMKRLKNLRKKLRDIELLDEKVKNGTLKNLDKDQKEKMGKKNDIIKEIQILEKQTSEWVYFDMTFSIEFMNDICFNDPHVLSLRSSAIAVIMNFNYYYKLFTKIV